MADEVTTPADSTSSTTDVSADSAPAEQSPSADAQAVEADPNATTEEEGSLLGGAVKEEADAPQEPEAPTVPEKYELSLDGLDLDNEAVEEAAPVFKELGLSNEQANKLMPAAAKFRDRIAEATLRQLSDAGAAQKAEWLSATKADPDIGGGKLEETLHFASKALDHFGFEEGSDFRKMLTETGFGNHPDMVRIMRDVGEMLSEDGFARANAGGSTTDAPLHERMYPNG